MQINRTRQHVLHSVFKFGGVCRDFGKFLFAQVSVHDQIGDRCCALDDVDVAVLRQAAGCFFDRHLDRCSCFIDLRIDGAVRIHNNIHSCVGIDSSIRRIGLRIRRISITTRHLFAIARKFRLDILDRAALCDVDIFFDQRQDIARTAANFDICAIRRIGCCNCTSNASRCYSRTDANLASDIFCFQNDLCHRCRCRGWRGRNVYLLPRLTTVDQRCHTISAIDGKSDSLGCNLIGWSSHGRAQRDRTIRVKRIIEPARNRVDSQCNRPRRNLDLERIDRLIIISRTESFVLVCGCSGLIHIDIQVIDSLLDTAGHNYVI